MRQLCLSSAVGTEHIGVVTKHGRNFTLHDQLPSVQQARGCCVWTSLSWPLKLFRWTVYSMQCWPRCSLTAVTMLAWFYNAERLDAGKT